MLSFGEMHRFEPKLIFGYRNSVFCEKAVCPWLDRLHFFGPQTVVLQTISAKRGSRRLGQNWVLI